MASKDLSHTPSLRLCSTRQVGLIGSWTLAASLFANVAAALNQEMQPILANQATRAMQPTLTEARQRLASLALPWVPNGGQWNERAAFRAQSFAGSVWVTKDGALIHEFSGPRAAECAADDSARTASARKAVTSCARVPGWVLTERFVGGRIGEISGRNQEIGRVRYQVGVAERHAENLPSYGQLDLGEVYPGVRVELKANHSNVEKLYMVAPRRDPRVIRMAIEGAQSLAIGESGSLIAKTGNGEIAFTPPIAFQVNAIGERVPVEVAYQLLTNDLGTKPSQAAPLAEYVFAVGAYDNTRSLVIDPLLQSTYVGGSANDVAYALAINPVTGDVYVAGSTLSTDMPGVNGGAQTTNAAGRDAFVSRFNSSLTSRLQSTYLGGGGIDVAYALAVHPVSAEVYLAGYTDSANFPGVIGGAQATRGGGIYRDAFVSRFNAALTDRLQSTYLGGGLDDFAYALAIHPTSSEVYVAGYTTATDFPAQGGAQVTKGAGADAFISRFNAALTSHLQSTFLGGGGNDYARALSIHPVLGDVYVAGYTDSTNLPGVVGGAQAMKGTGWDAFISRFNAALTDRLQSTYLGGTGSDYVYALATHPASGEVYVAGSTNSSALPGVSGGAQATKGQDEDAFISRFNAALTSRLQSTYLGGGGVDDARSLAIHPVSGEVYVVGATASSDLPGAVGGAQATKGVFDDAFISRFNSALTLQMQLSYLGGRGGDVANAVAIHPASGDVYVAGDTGSTDFPAAGGTQSRGGGADAFISGLTPNLEGCSLEINKDGVLNPLDEGIVLLRIARGQTTAAVVGGTRITETQLANRNAALAVCSTSCSVGQRSSNPAVAMDEGLVLLRTLLGFSSTISVAGTAISESQWLARRAALIACGNALP